jgi:predicted CXXCH cytochrome family protein
MNSGLRSDIIRGGLTITLIGFVALGIYLFGSSDSRDPSRRRSSPKVFPDQPTSARRFADPIAGADHTKWLPTERADRGFAGAEACRECHAENHASWRNSYHSTMTQTASEESVIPSFDDVTLEGRGRSWKLSRRGNEFWVQMPNPEWEMELNSRGVDLLAVSNPPIVDRQVVMTTGSHSFQTYWVAGLPQRLLVQLPWFYSIADEQWIPAEDSFLQPDPGRQFSQWNASCIRCHAVGGVPGISHDPQVAETSVVDLGISCEACHGPGEQHVSLRTAARQSGTPLEPEMDSIINPIRLTARQASHVCGQCHSKEVAKKDMTSFHQAGLPYRAGDDLEELRHILRFEDKVEGDLKDHFWNDGACRVGGDEFNGLIDSPCFQNGSGKSQLSCLSCHSMHHSDPNDQLGEQMGGNHACTQCHNEVQYTDQITTHTHHPPESSGSLCYNCHMPHSSFALLKGIRSHRIDSPEVFSTSHRGSRPNACNLCHLDQTLDWTAAHLTEWYGSPTATLTEDDQTIAAGLLWILSGDAVQRAVVAWHMGWESAQEASGSTWQAPFLGQLLQDPYAAVRLVANTALRSLPGFADFEFNAVDATLDRAAAVSEVISRWESMPPPEAAAERLIGDQGEIQRHLLDRLLHARDDTNVFINE